MGENLCDHSMDWREDDCNLKYINNIIINQFNCTVPWVHFQGEKKIKFKVLRIYVILSKVLHRQLQNMQLRCK